MSITIRLLPGRAGQHPESESLAMTASTGTRHKHALFWNTQFIICMAFVDATKSSLKTCGHGGWKLTPIFLCSNQKIMQKYTHTHINQ